MQRRLRIRPIDDLFSLSCIDDASARRCGAYSTSTSEVPADLDHATAEALAKVAP